VRAGLFDKVFLAVCAAAFLAVTLSCFPPMYLVSDEAGNLALAGVLAEGTPFADSAGRHLPAPVSAREGRRASRYPPGMAVLLMPFAAASPRAAFLLPLALHLLVFVLLARLLVRAGLSPIWAVLWLLYPTAALHSRVLMSNLPAAAVLLCAFALLADGRRGTALLAGLVLGLGVLLRPPLLPAGLILGVGAVWQQRRKLLAARWGKRLLSPPGIYALGVLPGVALYLAYNWYVFGSPLTSGYHQVGDMNRFGLNAALHCLPRYVLILMAVYPLMLVTPPFYRGRWKPEVVLLPAYYLLLYGSYAWFDAGSGVLETAVRAPRFLLPALPFLLLAYAGVISALLRRLPGLERGTLTLAALLGLVGCGLMINRHHDAQAAQAAARDALYERTEEGSVLVCSVETSELLQEAWGHRVVVDYASCDEDDLAGRLAAGKRAYFVISGRRGRPVFAAWGESLKRRLRNDGRFVFLQESGRRGAEGLLVWRLELASPGGRP
jgi:hypothetical protein